MGIISILALVIFFICYFTNKDKNANNDGLKEEKSSNKILLNIGVTFILFSSIIFATTSWDVASGGLKVIILALETLLFFGLGLLLKYILKVNKTGDSLIFTACFMLFAVMLSIGYFDILGKSFSLNGSNKFLFLACSCFLESGILYLRKLFKKDATIVFPILFLFVGIMFVFKMFTDDIAIYLGISLLLLVINIFKNKMFKNTLVFNIINYIFIGILSIVFMYLCVESLVYGNNDLIDKVPLLLMFVSLTSNLFLTNKKDNALDILYIIYEMFFVSWFAIFSGSVLNAMLLYLISGIVLYALYYVNENSKCLKITSNIISNLQFIIAIILFMFNQKYIMFLPFFIIMILILNVLSLLKNDEVKIFNYVMQPIYIILFIISILIQPALREMINFETGVLVVNAVLLVSLLFNKILKTKLTNVYLIISIIFNFLSVFMLGDYGLIYNIILFVINAIIIAICIVLKNKVAKGFSIASIILLILGQVLPYLEFIPWWAYLLVIGIVLVIIAAVKESKK